MGAVLLLVFLPLIMASLAVVATSSVAVGAAFVFLAAFVLGSLFHLARDWDREPATAKPAEERRAPTLAR
jgi:hypothetical protein